MFGRSKCERCDKPKSYGRVCDPCLKSGYRDYRPDDRGHIDFHPHNERIKFGYDEDPPHFSEYDIKKNWP